MELKEEYVTLAIEYGTRVVGVLVVLFIAWLGAGWVGRTVLRSLERARFDSTLSRFLAKISRWAILLFTVLSCLSMFGIQTTSFAAVIGASALAIGLAFHGTLSNFASGAMLLLFRPFKVGDVVNVAGHTGTVFEIDLFSTTLDTPDNRRIILPNSKVYGATIENKSYHTTRRIDVSVVVDYSTDIDGVREVLSEVALEVAKVLEEPEPQVVLTELHASSADWTVRLWVKAEDYGPVREEALRSVRLKLETLKPRSG